MVKNNPIISMKQKSCNGIIRQIRKYENKFSHDDLIEYANSLYEQKPEDKEMAICVPKSMYDLIEELRRNNYDKNINK